MSTDEEAVRDTLQNYVNACNSGDVELYKSTLNTDVDWNPPDQPAVHGREAVGAWAKRDFFDIFDVKFEPEYGQFEESDSKVYVPGTFALHLTPKDGSDASTATGAFFNTFSQDGDGTWKYQYAIFNFDQPQG